MKDSYPSDISREQFEAFKKVSGIKDILPWIRKGFPTR